jgi:tetratricopeptide (TPR) repeat protein
MRRGCKVAIVCLMSIFMPGVRGQATGQPPSEDASLEAIRTLLTEHRFAAAESSLRDYIEAHPDSASAHYLMGYTLFSEQKAAASLAEYTAGGRYRKPTAEDLMAIAADYILLNDNEDADKWLSEATRLQPENALAWYYLGRARFYESRYSEAASIFLTCLRLNPQDARAETNLGLAYKEMGKESDAIAAYQSAIKWEEETGSKDAQPYLDLGALLRQSEKAKESLYYLEKAVADEPNNPKVHEELGRAYEDLHRNKDAEGELRKAIVLAPESSSLHYTLGHILNSEGLKAEAEREFAITSHLNGTHSSKEVPNFDAPK